MNQNQTNSQIKDQNNYQNSQQFSNQNQNLQINENNFNSQQIKNQNNLWQQQQQYVQQQQNSSFHEKSTQDIFQGQSQQLSQIKTQFNLERSSNNQQDNKIQQSQQKVSQQQKEKFLSNQDSSSAKKIYQNEFSESYKSQNQNSELQQSYSANKSNTQTFQIQNQNESLEVCEQINQNTLYQPHIGHNQNFQDNQLQTDQNNSRLENRNLQNQSNQEQKQPFGCSSGLQNQYSNQQNLLNDNQQPFQQKQDQNLFQSQLQSQIQQQQTNWLNKSNVDSTTQQSELNYSRSCNINQNLYENPQQLNIQEQQRFQDQQNQQSNQEQMNSNTQNLNLQNKDQYQGQDVVDQDQNIQRMYLQYQDSYEIEYDNKLINIKTNEFQSIDINQQFLFALHQFTSQNFKYLQFYQKSKYQISKLQTLQQYAQEQFPHNEQKRMTLQNIYEKNQDSFNYILDLRRGQQSFFRTVITGFLISLFNEEIEEQEENQEQETLIQQIFIKFYYLKCRDINLQEKPYNEVSDLNKSMNYKNYFLNCILYLFALKLSNQQDSYIISELLKMCYEDEAFDFSMICFGISLCNIEIPNLKNDEVYSQFFYNSLDEIDCYQFEMNEIYQQALVLSLQVDIKSFTLKIDQKDKLKFIVREELLIPGLKETIFNIKMILHDNNYKLIFDEREKKNFNLIIDKTEIQDKLKQSDQKQNHDQIDMLKIQNSHHEINNKMIPIKLTQCQFCNNIDRNELIEQATTSYVVQVPICLKCATKYIKESKCLKEKYLVFKDQLSQQHEIKIIDLFKNLISKERQILKNCQCCEKNTIKILKDFKIEDINIYLNLCEQCLKQPQIKLKRLNIEINNQQYENIQKSNEQKISEQIFSKEYSRKLNYSKIENEQELNIEDNKYSSKTFNVDQNKRFNNLTSFQQSNNVSYQTQNQKEEVNQNYLPRQAQKEINNIKKQISSISISQKEQQINQKQSQQLSNQQKNINANSQWNQEIQNQSVQTILQNNQSLDQLKQWEKQLQFNSILKTWDYGQKPIFLQAQTTNKQNGQFAQIQNLNQYQSQNIKANDLTKNKKSQQQKQSIEIQGNKQIFCIQCVINKSPKHKFLIIDLEQISRQYKGKYCLKCICNQFHKYDQKFNMFARAHQNDLFYCAECGNRFFDKTIKNKFTICLHNQSLQIVMCGKCEKNNIIQLH
ncbi:hypothetical protein ABPG74_009918 [Tetrahymena malaccensis]